MSARRTPPARADAELVGARQLRAAHEVVAGGERERQREPLARLQPDLRGDVREVRGSADADTSASRRRESSGDGAERELDRAREVDLEADVARLAAAVLLDLLQRLDDRRRNPARRADHVPHHREPAEPSPRGGTLRSSRPRATPNFCGELDRPDPRDVLIGRVRAGTTRALRSPAPSTPAVGELRRQLIDASRAPSAETVTSGSIGSISGRGLAASTLSSRV